MNNASKIWLYFLWELILDNLNYKHLRYFWMVAKTGSIARASEQLYCSPQSISGQLGELENNLGVQLLK